MTSCKAASKVTASVAYDVTPGCALKIGILIRSHSPHQGVQDVVVFAFATPHVGGIELELITIHTLAVLSHSFDTGSMAFPAWAARQAEIVE